MFGGLFITASMLGMLRDFIERNHVHAPECLKAMEKYSPTSRLGLDEWSQLLQLIAQRYPQPGLGLAIGACVAPKHVGILGYMALSCSTLGEALLRYARYQRLVYDGNPGSVIADGDAIEIRWGIERGTPGQLVDETAISLFISYVRFLVEEPMKPMLITFVNPPPADLTPYTDFFGCPVRFNDTVTRVRFPLSHMTRELKQRDPALMDLLSQQAEALLVALPAADSFYDRLRSSIVRCIHDGTPDLPSVAGLMTMSTRTLQRRLQEKELEFNLVLDKIRSELAQRYLADKHLSFTDIALLLGYSEQSAFTRAFKRWFGVTPRDFKRGIGR
ncbi:MAG TPA: AraC family transcriptional regulator ligand-binding domain-containing protein [Fluviicoccus sp.]|nr:AraC family transcriptional regulator ligand-binding domain-containing protein [Fluviicoccus sp.]